MNSNDVRFRSAPHAGQDKPSRPDLCNRTGGQFSNKHNPLSDCGGSGRDFESDIARFVKAVLPPTDDANSKFFEERARKLIEALTLSALEKHGEFALSPSFTALKTQTANEVDKRKRSLTSSKSSQTSA